MKFAVMGLALAMAAAPIAGCSQVKVAVSEVVNACVQACNFVPEAESVINFLTVVPGVTTVEAAVNLLCDSFKKWEAANPPPALKMGEALMPSPKKITFTLDIGGKPIVVNGLAIRNVPVPMPQK